MAGGPTTTDLVIAAAGAGSLGFLAAGYKTPAAMTAQINAVRAATAEAEMAAAASGDTERMLLWAGQGYRLAAELPAGEIADRLCG